MLRNPAPDLARLKAELGYNPRTGAFWWIASGQGRRPSPGAATKQALYIRFNGSRYGAHHLAWFLHYGEWPTSEIDHRDGNPLNNRISNLRPADRQGQTRNQRRKSRGTSQYKGVSRHSQYPKRWVAQIRIESGRKKYIGLFDSELDAARRYDDFARKYHGEHACLNFPKQHERSAI